jgi:glycosyltransferase involved in cell wall biosynthesis
MYRFLLFMERMNFRVADVVIAPNESHRAIATGRGRVDPDRVFVVRSGPSAERFTRYQPDARWRNGRTHMVAYLGEIGFQDGVDNLVRAIAHLRDSGRADDIQFVFIGGGTARAEMMDLAAALTVDDLTTFTGVVSDDDLCRILSSADLAVDPVGKNAWSDRSTMNKIIEYMYFGLPIVGFDLTEARVSAADAGEFVNGRETDLADRVRALLDDKGRREVMGVAATRRFDEQLSWDHSISQLMSAYGMALESLVDVR